MDNILLSLCIPTYNRVDYLRELIPSLITELAAVNRDAIRVELLISDNASTDGTEAYLRGVSCRGINVFRNEKNIGGDRNFLACVERASGEYVWLFGDDDVLETGGIVRILELLTSLQPALLILLAGEQRQAVADEVIYSDYGACVRESMKRDESFALSHTLITSNVFRRDIFDLDEGAAMLYTNYAHMYGLVGGLKRGGRVVVKARVIRTRARRAQFDHWPTALCVKQAGYLWRVAGWFDVPHLRKIAFCLALNLPLEILACCAHRVFPGRFGRT